MLFNSIDYVIFFPLVVAAYFALPSVVRALGGFIPAFRNLQPFQSRWVLLLIASYYFYMSWKPEYIILIIISTMIDYYAAIRMHAETEQKKRTKYLVLSLMTNLGILFGFKYFNFFNDSARAIFESFSLSYHVPFFEVLLPVGISFYTFQTLSYSIDVYYGKREPERHLGIFALYVSFFPQLVAGPIERSTNLMPQFYQNHSFDYKRMSSGLKLMLWGFFKKLVVADRLGIYVDKIYEQPEAFGGISLLVATILFSVQIYCDFSAYSDIAIGTARTMGFDFMENFRRPYFSRSISEFWRRWHISLSTWFRDYLYIPLGGNRVKVNRMYFNLMTVFLVSGLWHGANWTFVVWGGLHGIYLVLALAAKPLTSKIFNVLPYEKFKVGYNTFNILTTYFLVLISWVFFRAENVTDGFFIVGEIFKLSGSLFAQGDFLIHLAYSGLAIALLMLIEFKQEFFPEQFKVLGHSKAWVRELSYAALAAIILLLGVFDGGQFIYFQF